MNKEQKMWIKKFKKRGLVWSWKNLELIFMCQTTYDKLLILKLNIGKWKIINIL